MNNRQWAIRRKILVLLIPIFILTTYYLLPTTASAQSVDLIWQADTYTPPFYKGRSLWTRQSKITVVAIPNIPGTNPSTLNYRWSKNDGVLGRVSGIGKNSIYFLDTILSNPVDIKVDIFSGDKFLIGETVKVTPQPAKIVIYEKNPLYGFLFNRAVGNTFLLPEGEVTFSAFPLFFSADSRDANPLSYTWRTNGSSSGSSDSITYRAPEGEEGGTNVSVRIFNQSFITQDISEKFLVNFGRN